MALGALPYKFRITDGSIKPGATDITLTFDILDGNNVVKATGQEINVSPSAAYTEMVTTLKERVWGQMETDAGTKNALLAGLLNKAVPVE